MSVSREQYAVLKEECRQIFSMIGSGRFITAPVITEDGYPIQDPLVLQEANEVHGPTENGRGGDFMLCFDVCITCSGYFVDVCALSVA